MHHRKAYMYINFQPNRVYRSIKTVYTKLFAKNCKLHKFATCNQNFEKSRLSDMHCPLTDILADFEINWPIKYLITAKMKLLTQTDGQSNRQFFFEKRKTTENEYFRHTSSYNVHVYQFSAKSGQQSSQNRTHKYICKIIVSCVNLQLQFEF